MIRTSYPATALLIASLTFGALLSLGGIMGGWSTHVSAAEDAATIIKARKAVMKDVVLKGFKATKTMIKDDFIDAEEAAAHMTALAKAVAGFETRFPKGTETGEETTAAPAIWQKPEGFAAGFVKLAADAKAAAAAAGDGDKFKALFKTMAKGCASCHKVYRIKK